MRRFVDPPPCLPRVANSRSSVRSHHLWCILWCMRRTNIYLDDEQTELLNRLARSQGVSRAEMIRRLLDGALRNEVDDVTADLAAIDESFGILASVDSPERSSGDREAHLARMWEVGS